jgi:hypothetical protein
VSEDNDQGSQRRGVVLNPDESATDIILDIAQTSFVMLETLLGAVEARNVWRSVPKQARAPRKPGPKGPRSPDRDRELLAVYEVILPALRGKRVIPRVAEALYRLEPQRFGNSVGAIERHLRRLLADRRRLIASLRGQKPRAKVEPV